MAEKNGLFLVIADETALNPADYPEYVCPICNSRTYTTVVTGSGPRHLQGYMCCGCSAHFGDPKLWSDSVPMKQVSNLQTPDKPLAPRRMTKTGPPMACNSQPAQGRPRG